MTAEKQSSRKKLLQNLLTKSRIYDIIYTTKKERVKTNGYYEV